MTFEAYGLYAASFERRLNVYEHLIYLNKVPRSVYACLHYFFSLDSYKLLCNCCYICLVFAFWSFLWLVRRSVQHNCSNSVRWIEPSSPIPYSYFTPGQPRIPYWVWARGIVLKKAPQTSNFILLRLNTLKEKLVGLEKSVS